MPKRCASRGETPLGRRLVQSHEKCAAFSQQTSKNKYMENHLKGAWAVMFRTAVPGEAAKITQLTLDSKRYWGYPEEFIISWTEELTILPEYISKNMLVVAEADSQLLGYVSIIEKPLGHVLEIGNYKISGGFFLDNLFVHPSHIRQGIGERLIHVAFDWCREREIKLFHVISDPNAKGFYEKMGAACLEHLPSDIAGRYLPFLIFRFET